MGLFLLSLLLPLSCLGQWAGVARTFTIVNSCPGDIWVGTAGTPTPGGSSGWRQGAGVTKKITVAGNSSAARIWGQTGCSWDGNGNPINCETGTNGAENTLFEWTFGQWNSLDWTDISLVDGWNMPMLVTTDAPGASGYNCGPIDCSSFTPAACPAELTLKNSDGSFQFCQNQCNAISNPTLTNQFPILNQVKSALQTCCNGGCTPTSGWPTSSNGKTYYNVFKSLCTTSYAWSGDDPTSMFSCSQNANYFITFCPGGSGSSGGGGSAGSSGGGSTTVSTPTTCQQWADSDFSGGDLQNGPQANTDACCSWCQSTSGCVAWSYYLGVCYLKNQANARILKSGVTAGLISASCTGATQDFAGSDLPGMPLQYTGSDDASKDASCCSACSQNANCQFWVRATDSNNCWLKTGFTGPVAASNRRGNFQATCGFIGTVQDFGGSDLPGMPIQYTGSDDASKDASCCNACLNNASCQFWVRATDSNNCWLKTGFTGFNPASNRRGNHKASFSGAHPRFAQKHEVGKIVKNLKSHSYEQALQP